MLILSVLAAALPAAVAQPGVPEPPAVVLEAPTSVPFTMDFDKPVIEAVINGQGPFPFILDTGCSPLLILNDDLADELGLERGEADAVGDPSNPSAIPTAEVLVESVRIGDAEFTRVEGLSWANPGLFHGEGSPRGIIGLTMLGGVLATFDFPGGQVTLSPGTLDADDPRTVAYTNGGGIPEIPISVAGRAYTAHLDTGAGGGVMLNIGEAERLPLSTEPEVVGVGRTVNSEIRIYSATLDGELRIGPLAMINPRIGFRDVFEQASIGCGAFEHAALTFDQRSRLVRIDVAGGRVVEQPGQRKRYGIMALPDRETGDLMVQRCVEGSPAARAGVREGDTIVAINGTPIADLGAVERMQAFEGSPITLTVLRDGEELEFELSLDG